MSCCKNATMVNYLDDLCCTKIDSELLNVELCSFTEQEKKKTTYHYNQYMHIEWYNVVYKGT